MPSLDDLDWPVLTDRLVIRRATPEDLEATWAFRRRPDVTRWMGGAPRTLEEYAQGYLEPKRMAETLVVEHDGTVIGDLTVEIRDGWAQEEVAEQARGTVAELGWVLDPDRGGHGFATEAVRALLGICFDGLGLRRVVALCFADNEPSWRLMERVGLRREGLHLRESLHRDRGWIDSCAYALLAEEWRERS